MKTFIEKYSIVGVIAAVCCAIKFILFYNFTGFATHIVLTTILSCFFTLALFSAFRIKWIPAAIFTGFSCLMFCDTLYCAYFGKYLSFRLTGQAQFIGDVMESILAIFQFRYFLLLADCVLIFIAIAIAHSRNKKKSKSERRGLNDSERTKRRKLRENKARVALVVCAVIVCLIVILNFGSDLLTSLSNTEFYSYHIKDIFVTASDSGTIEKKGNLAAFTDSYESEKDGDLFGVAEGRNVFIIQIESFQNFVIGREYNGREITPNLNMIINDNSIYFDNFYQQIGSGNTSDAEFATNNSIYGSITSFTYQLYPNNYFRGLPWLLKDKGYETAVFHAYEDKTFWNREAMYPNEGFDHFFGGLTGREPEGQYDMTEWMGWGLTDTEFLYQSMPYIESLKQPFYSFIITLSNHHPYKMLDHYKFIDLLPEDEDTMVGNYIQSAAYTDFALGQFFQLLKEAGLYENSIFVMYGDHVGLTHSHEVNESMDRILGKTYDYDELMHIPCIIHMPGADPSLNFTRTVSTAGGQLDTMPTLAYLLGFESLDTVYLGHNLLTIEEGLVAEQTYMTKGSFFTNDVAYEMSRDGVFANGRAWNIHTGESVDVEECYENYLKATDIINTSEYILKSDALRKILLEGQSAEEAGQYDVHRAYPESICVAGAPDAALIGSNSKEALDYSYLQEYKTLRLDIDWNEESRPVALDRATGEVAMTFEEIIEWLESHGNAVLVANVQRSGDYFISLVMKENKSLNDRLIVEHPETSQYSGKFDGILDAGESGQTPEEIMEFIKNNNVWAVYLTAEEAAGEYAALLGLDTPVYADMDGDGIIERAN